MATELTPAQQKRYGVLRRRYRGFKPSVIKMMAIHGPERALKLVRQKSAAKAARKQKKEAKRPDLEASTRSRGTRFRAQKVRPSLGARSQGPRWRGIGPETRVACAA